MPYCQNSSCSPCEALSQVEIRLAEAKALVEHLTVETYRLKSAVNTAHDPLTHRFPQELVSRIFIFSIQPFAWLLPSSDPMFSDVGTLQSFRIGLSTRFPATQKSPKIIKNSRK